MDQVEKDPMNTAAHNRVRETVERFEAAWARQGESARFLNLASFLPASGDSLRLPTLHELIRVDLANRWTRGIPVSLEDYLEKFPELGPADQLPPQLIHEEYRIRAEHGVPMSHSVISNRFPKQASEVIKLITAEQTSKAQQPTTAAAEAPAMMLSGGMIVGGHYRLNKLLGRGGFGEVWHGTDLRGNIDKAIKVLIRSADSEEGQAELTSLDVIKRLNHPCLLRTESYFTEQDRLFIVMELADNTLRGLLKEHRKVSNTGLPARVLMPYMRQSAEGLDFLHKQGIFHRDIKPENILLVGDYAKVADFGLVKAAHNKQSTHTEFAGTFAYSSPETWEGRVTPHSDQYSLAATYVELRLGRGVFHGKTFQEIFAKHMQMEPKLDPLPAPEQAVLLKALAKKPENRYPSCTTFVRELDAAVPAADQTTLPYQDRGPREATTDTPSGVGERGVTPRHPSSSAKTTQPADASVAIPAPGWKEGRRPVRPGRRKTRIVIVAIVGVLLLAVPALALLERHHVETTARAHLDKGDFAAALREIDQAGWWIAPFRQGLYEMVRDQAVDALKSLAEQQPPDQVQKACRDLAEAFPGDARTGSAVASVIRGGPLPSLLKQEKFADAHRLLDQVGIRDGELIDSLRKAWHDAALARFSRDSLADKEAGLTILAERAKIFPTETASEIARLQADLGVWLLPQAEAELKASRPEAKALLTRVEGLLEKASLTPELEGRFQAARLLAMLEGDEVHKDPRVVGPLFAGALGVADVSPLVGRIVAFMVKEGRKDAALLASVREPLERLPKTHPKIALPAEYLELFPPPISAGRKRFTEALAFLEKKDPQRALEVLTTIDVAGDRDATLRADVQKLYPSLIATGRFPRARLRELATMVADHPASKAALTTAMTRELADTYATWPTKDDSWELRRKDSELADPKSPMMLALRAESLLETGAKVEFTVPTAGEGLAYLDYARARLLAAQGEYAKAARLLERLSDREAWFVPQRRERASQVLQAAALSLGSPQSAVVFHNGTEATQAYSWHRLALDWSAKPGDSSPFPRQTRIHFAMAAAFKSDPAFEEYRRIVTPLVKERSGEGAAPHHALLLADPVGFAAELQRVRDSVSEKEIIEVLTLGKSQLKADPQNAAATQRQAALFHLWGGIAERKGGDLEKVRDYYAEAARVEPKNRTYRLAKGRMDGVLALNQARAEKDRTKRIRILLESCEVSDAVTQGQENEESWADYCVVRSQLARQLANAIDPKDAKAWLANARQWAEAALNARMPATDPDRAWLALGNACEDLAHLGRDDLDNLYQEALRAYESVKGKSTSALDHGRCLYRLAMDPGLKHPRQLRDKYLQAAVRALAPLAKRDDGPDLAEANYWEGSATWDLINRITPSKKARLAFDRSLRAAAREGPGSWTWAAQSLRSLTDMTRLQWRNAPRESQLWLEGIEEIWTKLQQEGIELQDDSIRKTTRDYRDVLADTLGEVATANLRENDLEGFRRSIDKAVRLNHSQRHHVHLTTRALTFKKERDRLAIGNAELATLRQQTLTAIASADHLSSFARTSLTREFEANWEKTP